MESKIVILVRQAGLGHIQAEDKQFGLEMFDRFLHTLEGEPVKPQAICFYTEGVKLVCQGSSALQSLSFLHGMGVRIVTCRTCLDYFKLLDQVAIGEVGGMNDIVKLLFEADKVITV
jgi:hypothetical protein